ncbi:hypothetical protein [Hyphomicrobium sp.]|uniref:hypothetical protein n=1 Tax=Hyphomicrobium sp. TaxID=82 RepID=UPI002B8BB7C7|nr:hypothetical protein [Hyphomicrobium sp.]HRN89231.1 hypothetical protein [Hyphomicrobium sp.]HRQ27673.1 hypothetical protein [Hyphomicrobium sp.]
MTMKKHVVSLALAASMATAASVAAMADEAQMPAGEPALGDTENPTSGPGVQGHPDTRTGPATRVPGGEEGAGEGAAGSDVGGTTQPSQDSTGVQGFPDTRTGPAEHRPDGAADDDTK